MFNKYLCVVLFLITLKAYCLPIGFGIHQNKLSFKEKISEHFIVYYDKRVPYESTQIINSLEGVLPLYEKWFGINYNERIPVVVSSLTSNASFANFVTNAIELQTLGNSSRDLPWHELVHIMNYKYYHNIFGPAGAVLHLPWIPAWFLEGLAEALTSSISSTYQASIERYQALLYHQEILEEIKQKIKKN